MTLDQPSDFDIGESDVLLFKSVRQFEQNNDKQSLETLAS